MLKYGGCFEGRKNSTVAGPPDPLNERQPRMALRRPGRRATAGGISPCRTVPVQKYDIPAGMSRGRRERPCGAFGGEGV